MIKEEWMNICLAEGLTKEEAEYGFSMMLEKDFDLPSTLLNRRILIGLIRETMPEFIQARKKEFND